MTWLDWQPGCTSWDIKIAMFLGHRIPCWDTSIIDVYQYPLYNIAPAAPKSNMELNHGSLEHDCFLHVFFSVLAVRFQGKPTGCGIVGKWGNSSRLRWEAVQAYEEHLEWRKMSHVQELLKVTWRGRAGRPSRSRRHGAERSDGSWLQPLALGIDDGSKFDT